MAMINVTLAAAMAAGDGTMTVSASTGLVAKMIVEIDGESLQIASGYTTGANGVVVPVLRGQNGTYAFAHPSGAKVRIAAGTDSDWGRQAPQTISQYPIATPARQRTSYTAAGAITLPNVGNDMVAFLNGTSVLAMTVADPGTALDGSFLWIIGNGVAAHTVTFASGLSNTGASGSYDVITFNASGAAAVGPFMAVNGFWEAICAVPIAGAVTNVTATLS